VVGHAFALQYLPMIDITDTLVLIKGAGDLASGVAARLFRCGFPVVMTELPHPLMVRRTVAFGEAVYEGEVGVEGIIARRQTTPRPRAARSPPASSPCWSTRAPPPRPSSRRPS
jgi:hypothetical protein